MTHEEQERELADTVATKIWHAQNCDPGECICSLICRGDLDDISAEFGITAALAQAAQEAVEKVEAARDLNWSFFLSEQELTNGLREEMQKLQAQLQAAQPVWTRDQPTVAGWYWWRFTADSRYVVFDLTEQNGVLYRRDDSGKLWEYPEDGEWAGPLTLPMEA